MTSLIMKFLGVEALAARLITGLAVVLLCVGSFVWGCSMGKDLERADWEQAKRVAVEKLREAEAQAGDAFDNNQAAAETGIAAQGEERDNALPEDDGAPIGAADLIRFCIELRRQDRTAWLADSACQTNGARGTAHGDDR